MRRDEPACLGRQAIGQVLALRTILQGRYPVGREMAGGRARAEACGGDCCRNIDVEYDLLFVALERRTT